LEDKEQTLHAQLQDSIQRISDLEKDNSNCRKRATDAEEKLNTMVKLDKDYRARQITKCRKLQQEITIMEDDAKAVCLP